MQESTGLTPVIGVRALRSQSLVTISLSYIFLIRSWKCCQRSWVAGRCCYWLGLLCTERWL